MEHLNNLLNHLILNLLKRLLGMYMLIAIKINSRKDFNEIQEKGFNVFVNDFILPNEH